LRKFARYGFDIAPDIPPAKLQKAMSESQMPKDETALGLIEGKVFGWYSCLVFGARGIYYCNPKSVLGGQPGPGSVAYTDFSACEFKAGVFRMRVNLCGGKFLDLSQGGTMGSCMNLIAEVLNNIKKLVMTG